VPVGTAIDLTAAGWPHVHGIVAHNLKDREDYILSVFNLGSSITPHIKAVDGLFIAATRKLVEAIPFDEETFTGFHVYDLDFSFRAYLAGFKLAVANDILLLHQSDGSYDEKWLYYHHLFRQKFANYLDENVAQPHEYGTITCLNKEHVMAFWTECFNYAL
jgi:GT2 family glycosyltransferase